MQVNNTPIATIAKTDEKIKFSLREVVVKYLSYLPLFILSLVIFLGTALMYIRYKVPIYRASVQMMVNTSTNNNQAQQDIINQAVSGVRTINLENEMQLIRSKKLLERVVINGGFNIYYAKEGNIKTYDAYTASPIEFVPLKIADSNRIFTIRLASMDDNGAQIETSKGIIPYKWNDSITIQQFSFKILKKDQILSATKDPFIIKWLPISYTAAQLQGAISVSTLSSKTSVLILSIVGENRRKGEDILNTLVQEIIKNDVEQKQEASVSTINFIDGRLNMVGKDLGDLEGSIRDFKKDGRFFDVQGEYLYYQGRLTKSEDVIESINLEINVLDSIASYVKNNKSVNKSKIIPSTFEIADATFSSLVSQYNQLLVQYEKTLNVTYKENNTVKEIEEQIKQIKASILEAAANLKSIKKDKLRTFENRFSTALGNLSGLPEKEKFYQDIARQKQIKEKLYLYLLQRREETAISSISTKSNYKEMDGAGSSSVPVEPKSSQIKVFALILGILFPVAFIYLIDVLNDKITTRIDISTRTDIPIAGEISHVDNSDTLVVENSRNIVAEQFRILRSNLQFILPKLASDKQASAFLVTSSISGEGKSFISLNLAAVLSLTYKKVALLEFDLRKIKGINNKEIEDNNDRGITNYLIGQSNNPETLYKTLSKNPNLHVYNTGPIPPNPAELIIGNRMESFFVYLKANYDYIVIDSAPVGLVSDSFALMKYADAVMYIVRQRYTFKKQIEFINDLRKDGKLTNMAIVVNDVNLAGRYGYYGYGYGYGYGYMYKYGQGGYGYGRYIYGGKKKDPYFDANKKGYFDNQVKLSWWQRLFGRR
ncbi:MAG: polysaccharide biosynthesis tyrosine autokinase [Chitinophagaceae bacterium]|nr:polysaccharide biosynthesis tyrosine autokinase [Chitinophagaceae bacterium]